MKNYTKLLGVVFLLLSWTAKSQTYVHGGIYSSTTWTKGNSPYIVTDTIVVFPGVTLTLEPGVTVKFADGKFMEIRQGTLNVAGTVNDSITITSNSTSPTLGIYIGILFTNAVAITIDYCHFEYADQALNLPYGNHIPLTIDHSYFLMNNNAVNINNSSVTLVIQHSDFYLNNYCIPEGYSVNIMHTAFYNNNNCVGQFAGFVDGCFLDSCIFMNNQFGVDISYSGNTTNCIFNNNGTALFIDDDTKYKVSNSIFCNNTDAISMRAHQSNDTIINCNFSQNHIAVQSFAPVDYVVGNILTENDTAISYGVIGSTDSVFNNYIFHNQVGIVYGGGASANFFNNYICNNTLYNIIYTPTTNGSIPPVCFCDADSSTIRSKILDGYVDISRGLLNFTPFVHCDSSVITSIPPINCQTLIVTQVKENTDYSLSNTFESYPNPTSHYLTVQISANNPKAEIKIFNMLSEIVYSSLLTKQKTSIDVSTFANGMYIIQITTGNNIARQKFIEEKNHPITLLLMKFLKMGL